MLATSQAITYVEFEELRMLRQTATTSFQNQATLAVNPVTRHVKCHTLTRVVHTPFSTLTDCYLDSNHRHHCHHENDIVHKVTRGELLKPPLRSLSIRAICIHLMTSHSSEEVTIQVNTILHSTCVGLRARPLCSLRRLLLGCVENASPANDGNNANIPRRIVSPNHTLTINLTTVSCHSLSRVKLQRKTP